MSPEVQNKEKYHEKAGTSSFYNLNEKKNQVTHRGNEKCRCDLKFAERKRAKKSRQAIQGRKNEKTPSQGERAIEVA